MNDWKTTRLAVPIMKIPAIDADESTHEVLEDWHYWINMGYEYRKES
jgi:hypothetical protein